MIRMLLILSVLLTPCVSAAETLNSVYIEGIAPITIDGDLTDWTFVTTGPISLNNTMRNWWNWTSSIPDQTMPVKTPEDLSGSFQCFTDNYNLYVAVRVSDDQVISGREPFSFNLFDDCVEITFNSDTDQWFESGNYVQIRVFTDDRTEKTFVEMRGLFPPFQTYPYIWEELGVKAVLKKNDTGYTVEAAIPSRFVGLSQFELNCLINMNVKINDYDENEDKDCALIWAKGDDIEEGLWYNSVYFNTPVSLSQDSDVSATLDSDSNTIVAVLGNPDAVQSFDNAKAIFQAYSQRDFVTTENLINSSTNNSNWKNLFLGNIRFDTKNFSESGQILEGLAKDAQDLCLSRKALYQAGRAYMRAGDKMKALDIFGDVLLSTIENHSSLGFINQEILGQSISELISNESVDSPLLIKKNEIMDNFVQSYIRSTEERGVNPSNYLRLAQFGVVRVKAYNAALPLLEKVIQTSADNEIRQKAQLELARIYFYTGNYDPATQLAEELINSSSDSKTALDARMIVLSIAQKK